MRSCSLCGPVRIWIQRGAPMSRAFQVQRKEAALRQPSALPLLHWRSNSGCAAITRSVLRILVLCIELAFGSQCLRDYFICFMLHFELCATSCGLLVLRFSRRWCLYLVVLQQQQSWQKSTAIVTFSARSYRGRFARHFPKTQAMQ
jgi:hypothetical protein